MDASALAAFALAFFVFAASPGPDNMTIVARTVSNGASSGIVYGLGTLVGILIYLGLAAFGLSLFAKELGLVLTVVRYAGAAYLIYVAYRLWTDEPVVPHVAEAQSSADLVKVFATAIALNLAIPRCHCFTWLCFRASSVRISAGPTTRHLPASSCLSKSSWSADMSTLPAGRGL